MAGLLLYRPLSFVPTAAGGWSGLANLQTKSPREICIAPGTGSRSIDIDLGAVVSVDCIYLGSTNARADAVWTVQSIAAIGGAATATLAGGPMRLAKSNRARHPAFARFAAPVAARYLRISVNQPVTPIEIGILAPGLAFDWPYAYGSGRMPIDTGVVVGLPDGGFGIDEGVVKKAFQWRFVDLDEDALDNLWAIAEEVGESKPIVAIEGPDYPPKATATHYGLFRKFDYYEREDAASSKWALTIEEWR